MTSSSLAVQCEEGMLKSLSRGEPEVPVVALHGQAGMNSPLMLKFSGIVSCLHIPIGILRSTQSEQTMFLCPRLLVPEKVDSLALKWTFGRQ